jgi:hypothetical protein
MNNQEFKHHLKDLVHGKHHPEEHDWAEPRSSTAGTAPKPTARRRTAKKPSRRK